MILLSSMSSIAQTFNLKIFNTVSGLPQNYVYSVVQDPNGYIWVAMAEGLSRYDGVKFTNYTTRDSIADIFVSKLLIDTDGRLWCGHGNGAFSILEQGEFTKLIVEDTSAPIKDMCLDDKGNIWAVEQNKGLIKITPDKQVTTYFDREKFGRRIYYSVQAVNSMTLLVGTSDGMMIVKTEVDGTLKEPQDVDELPCSAVQCIVKARDGRHYWVGFEEGEIYKYTIGEAPIRIDRCNDLCVAEEEASHYNVKTIFEDDQNNLYIGTWGEGIKEWKYKSSTHQYVESLSLTEENGLGNNYVSDIVIDREGIFWFATYGGGVVAWINNYFSEYNLNDIGFQRNKVISSLVDGNDLWLGMNTGIIRMNVQCIRDFEYFDNQRGLPQGSAITSICFDKNHKYQFVSTDNVGVYYKAIEETSYHKLIYDRLSLTNDKINGMAIDKQNLYLATQGGFVVYNLNDHTTQIYTTNDQVLPHNNINFVYVDSDGQVWLGPKDSGIAMYVESGRFEIHRLADTPINVAGMTIDQDDRMWLATYNTGIICSENDSLVSISTSDGLEKNYCYGIATDANNRIWVCHQPGLSCIDLNTGNIRRFNSTNGVGQEFLGVTADLNGDLWFSSSSGVVHYMSHYDKRNSIAPIINLTNIIIAGKRHDRHEPIELPYPYNNEEIKFEFDYIGICMKDPMNVRYEYWLQDEGSEDENWSDNGVQTRKSFDYMRVGKHILHIRAINGDGEICAKPLEIPISIAKPFWNSIWFPIVLIAIIAAAVKVITKMRERKLKQRQKELEDEVSRQTSLLNKQKVEIQRKNEDIMDSINYAKRIQTAILPSLRGLKNYDFAGSFILFMPRDVVSGDFYWFSQFDNKVLICCGDCTGHGVPGAFMSMIGTTILNDSTRDPEMRTPAKLLYQLDKEVKSTLNKNQAVETQDGMDCAIIEIDMETFEVKSAAARRPVYFFTNGRLTEQRGTRRSIGDHRNGNDFIESTIQLQKGDTIYMSSDGFTDQFGGENGDKYTAGALKRFIETIVNESLDDQPKMFEQEFHRWKGRREQIDDVIIMGIKI